MPIAFPDLVQSNIELLSVSAIFPADNQSLVGKVAQEIQHLESSYDIGGGVFHVQALTGRPEDGDFLCLVNIATEGYLEKPPVVSPDDRDSIDSVQESIQRFIGEEAKIVSIRGRFAVKRSELPQNGLALGLFGLKTKVSGEELVLSGASFSISGTPFNSIEFEAEEDDTVVVKLQAYFQNFVLNEDYLLSASGNVNKGVDRFLLEKSEDQE